jgi:SAM-dependent methyltransferase
VTNFDLSGVSKLYSDSLAKHGAEAQGVGWRDPASHRLRFDKLVAVIERRGERLTINDLGCGYGAFFGYLTECGIDVGRFNGYDISSEMLAEARRRLASQSVRLVQSAVLDSVADYSFACGIFNVRLDRSEDEWRDHILKTLEDMNAHSEAGFAFNLLTSYVDWKEPHLFYGDPLFFFDYCKKNISRYVTLLHDYPLWEWTILVRK